MEKESPVLCSECLQWLCAAKDAFCANCGAQLVRIVFSSDKLVLNGDNNAIFKLFNRGRFDLYWAAEFITPEPSVRALFHAAPDYGMLHPGGEQVVDIRFMPDGRNPDSVRAFIEIASNDPIRYEVKLPILTDRETDASTDTQRR